MNSNPLARFTTDQGLIILDGGLATALETHGHDLNDSLWSAKLLIEDPDAIRDQHTAYLKAGADCISTATYQASLPGFRARGLDEEQSLKLMKLAVDLAVEARPLSGPTRKTKKIVFFPWLLPASVPMAPTSLTGLNTEETTTQPTPSWPIFTAVGGRRCHARRPICLPAKLFLPAVKPRSYSSFCGSKKIVGPG